jgi:D-alanine-D-alanine ligase
MKVLVLHTLAAEVQQAGRVSGEFELDATAANVAAALPGSVVCGVRGDVREILRVVEAHRPDVVFNLCEAPNGRADLEAHAAALFEWIGVRFTGCRSDTLALCRRKEFVKAVLREAGVRVPDVVDPAHPRFPCIAKPADEDGSAGLYRDSVCETAVELDRALDRLPGRPIVEEFMPGREFVVSLWGATDPEHHSIGETVFQNGLRLITYEGKWDVESPDFADTPMFYNSDIAPGLRDAILAATRASWRAVGARHSLRIDVRLDVDGGPRVLDVNPNPEMGLGVGICRAVQEAGWTWERFVRSLVEWA